MNKFRYVLKHKPTKIIIFRWYNLYQIERTGFENLFPFVPFNDYEIISRDKYIGLEDANGKEIYEGDIFSNPLYEILCVVEYVPHLAAYVGYGKNRKAGCYLITDEDIKIVGNIHEKPELLKESK